MFVRMNKVITCNLHRRMMKPTKRQLQFLAELGAKNVGDITREQASQLIDRLLEQEYKSGRTFKCPNCKSEFGPRPRRYTVCQDCGETIIHLSGRFYTEEQADKKCHRDWLKEWRACNRETVRDDLAFEKMIRKDRNVSEMFGYRVKVCSSCEASSKFHGVIIPLELAVKRVDLLPPYETCDHITCECEFDTIPFENIPDGAIIVSVSETGALEYHRFQRNRATGSGCAILPLLLFVLFSFWLSLKLK